MDRDPIGTLQQVADIGYADVETSARTKMPAQELRKVLNDLGLKSSSGHYLLPDLLHNLSEQIDFAQQLGQEYMIIVFPSVPDPSRFSNSGATGEMETLLTILHGLTLDDWKWNAEQCNRLGEQTKKAGLQLGYHNHNFEFRSYGSTTGYDEFLRLTDPELVVLQLDCAWITVAGQDPVAYLTEYPARYRLLHIKDFGKGFTSRTTLMDGGPGAPVPTELGRGMIDYRQIFTAAQDAPIRAYYVEQEPPYEDVPALEAIKINYDYLQNLFA